MSTPDLKPCPFCGAEAAYTEHEKTNETRGWCPRGCGAEGPFGARSLGPGWGDAMARDGWNIRPIEDALRARAEAAEAALATARAEGAAAERAAIVSHLRDHREVADRAPGWGVDAGPNPTARRFALRVCEDIEAGAHVRPVEGA